MTVRLCYDFTVLDFKLVVILGALERSGFKSIAELYPLNAGNPENSFGDRPVDTVEHRSSKTDGKTDDFAFNDTSHGIAFCFSGENVACKQDLRRYADAAFGEGLEREGTRDAHGRRHAAGIRTSARWDFTVLYPIGIIGVAGTRNTLFVVAASSIGVYNHSLYRLARSNAILYACNKLRFVRFASWS